GRYLRREARPDPSHARELLHGDHRDRSDDRTRCVVIGMVANLARWEWFKLRRRWMLWILLVFAILFGQLAVWGSFFSYQNLQSTGGELTVPASLQSQQGRPPRAAPGDALLAGAPRRQPSDPVASVGVGV